MALSQLLRFADRVDMDGRMSTLELVEEIVARPLAFEQVRAESREQ
jgi:hypothetical protein